MFNYSADYKIEKKNRENHFTSLQSE